MIGLELGQASIRCLHFLCMLKIDNGTIELENVKNMQVRLSHFILTGVLCPGAQDTAKNGS